MCWCRAASISQGAQQQADTAETRQTTNEPKRYTQQALTQLTWRKHHKEALAYQHWVRQIQQQLMSGHAHSNMLTVQSTLPTTYPLPELVRPCNPLSSHHTHLQSSSCIVQQYVSARFSLQLPTLLPVGPPGQHPSPQACGCSSSYQQTSSSSSHSSHAAEPDWTLLSSLPSTRPPALC